MYTLILCCTSLWGDDLLEPATAFLMSSGYRKINVGLGFYISANVESSQYGGVPLTENPMMHSDAQAPLFTPVTVEICKRASGPRCVLRESNRLWDEEQDPQHIEEMCVCTMYTHTHTHTLSHGLPGPGPSRYETPGQNHRKTTQEEVCQNTEPRRFLPPPKPSKVRQYLLPGPSANQSLALLLC